MPLLFKLFFIITLLAALEFACMLYDTSPYIGILGAGIVLLICIPFFSKVLQYAWLKEKYGRTLQEYCRLINPSRGYLKLGADKIQVLVSKNLIKLFADEKNGNFILSASITAFRFKIINKTGYVIPEIRILDNAESEDNTIEILFNEIKKAEFKITPDDEGLNLMFETLGFLCIKHADEILRNDDAINYIEHLKENNKNEYDYLIKHTGRVRQVLANLIKENISVKNIVKIAELICFFGFENHSAEEISELIRTDSSTKSFIKEKYSKNNEISAYELSDDFSELIKSSASYKQEQEIIGRIKQCLNTEKENIILCEKAVRLKLYRIISDIFPKTDIIAYEELLKTVNINCLGILSAD